MVQRVTYRRRHGECPPRTRDARVVRARARGFRQAAEDQISFSSRTTTISPTLTPPVLPRLAAYATRSNVIRKLKKPGGGLTVHYVKKKTKGPQTPSGDHGRIHGVSALLGFF